MVAHTHEYTQTQIMHVMLTKEGKRTSFEIETTAMHSPHDAMTGNSGCLAMDLILPEHFPKKHPTNFPVRKQCINKKKKRYKSPKSSNTELQNLQCILTIHTPVRISTEARSPDPFPI